MIWICAGKICSVFMRGEDVIKGSRVINIFCLISSVRGRDANRESWWERDRRDLASEHQDLGILRGNFFVEGSEGGF